MIKPVTKDLFIVTPPQGMCAAIAHGDIPNCGTDEFGSRRVGFEPRPAARSDRQSERVSLMIVVSIVVVPMPVTMIVLSIAVVPMPMIVLFIVLAAFVVRFVFCGPHEVDWPIAGIILSAMLAPIPRMAGRHM
jgi:hypothetical protein